MCWLKRGRGAGGGGVDVGDGDGVGVTVGVDGVRDVGVGAVCVVVVGATYTAVSRPLDARDGPILLCSRFPSGKCVFLFNCAVLGCSAQATIRSRSRSRVPSCPRLEKLALSCELTGLDG